MTALEAFTLAGAIVGLAGGLYAIAEKIWGGGNKLATAFAKLKQETVKDIHDLRSEFITKVDTHGNNTKIGIDAIMANIHTMQLGTAEFRAFMAENYIKRDSYYKAMDDWKKDFKEAMADFKKDIREDIGEVKNEVNALALSVEAARRERNT